MPRPDDVGRTDMYDRMRPEPLIERSAQIREDVRFAIRNPTDADGWAGVLIPAIVTGAAITMIRRLIS